MGRTFRIGIDEDGNFAVMDIIGQEGAHYPLFKERFVITRQEARQEIRLPDFLSVRTTDLRSNRDCGIAEIRQKFKKMIFFKNRVLTRGAQNYTRRASITRT